jgi:hypothetical protein
MRKIRGKEIMAFYNKHKLEVERLNSVIDSLEGARDYATIKQKTDKLSQQLDSLKHELTTVQNQLSQARAEIIETNEIAIMQEVGIYEYAHPLANSTEYKAKLMEIRSSIKQANKGTTNNLPPAITANTTWTINNSAAQGRKMVYDIAKLMLRSYNSEADDIVRTIKPYKRDQAITRLRKVAATIERLGKVMNIEITDSYERLRETEIRLAADFANKLAEEKEAEVARRERLKEEERAQKELAAIRAKHEKELAHLQSALAKARAGNDSDAIRAIEEQIPKVQEGIEDVEKRAANTSMGYVYVISNIGSFGDNVVKIGMTRRLNPMDRVRELGDASVPFVFDVHMLHFSENASGVEAELHRLFTHRRVNMVNYRKEYFSVTAREVYEAIQKIDGHVLEFNETAPAEHYYQSLAMRKNPASS